MAAKEHEVETKKRRVSRRLVWLVLIAVTAAAAGGYFWHRRFVEQLRRTESCANCRSFLKFMLPLYAGENGGWFPRGGATPLDSLALLAKERHDVHHFTSHAWSPMLEAHWEKHRTFTPEFTSYRYNEGLREDDPFDLLLLYFHRPTFYECGEPSHRQKALGRPVLTVPGFSWEFLPEGEFQKRQSNTVAYLEAKGRLKQPAKAP